MTRRFLFFSILLIVTAVFSVHALDIKEGRIKLVLHENTGRFSAYYLTDLTRGSYEPFFLTEDPRTSFLSVMISNRIYRMGESSGFKQTIERTSGGARFVWRSSFAEVSEEFSFIRSADSPVADGFLITVRITNISEQEFSSALRYLFDTHLAEGSNIHFQTDSINRVSGETVFTQFAMPTYFSTPSPKEGFSGFRIMLKGTGITKPEKAVLANWKRLNDAAWDYSVKTSSNFNLLPYSVNDSAAALYYTTQDLMRRESREIVLAMGHAEGRGFSADSSGVRSEIEAVFDKTVQSSEAITDPDLAVRTDLLTITDLIDKIDKGLENGEEIRENEIILIEQVIEELKKRKVRYDSQ